MREPYGWFGGCCCCCCCCCLLFADGDYLMLLTRVLRSQGLTGGLLRMYSIPRNNNSAVHDVSTVVISCQVRTDTFGIGHSLRYALWLLVVVIPILSSTVQYSSSREIEVMTSKNDAFYINVDSQIFILF